MLDQDPPGLVPWMIVRTHEYACERGDVQRLHWQKGMFLRHKGHGEAMLELRGREFHLYTQAVWPDYFMNVLRQTLYKLITDNWPGLEGRYSFTVPCRERENGAACAGRFDIDALGQFLNEGDETIRCQDCRTRQDIVKLLYGFEDVGLSDQLRRIEEKLDGLGSRLANYVMGIMLALANEAKDGPRLYTIEPAGGDWRMLFAKRYRLQLWCEAEGCQHPVYERGKGLYEFEASRDWVKKVAPYANFIAGVLKTVLPMAAPAANLYFGAEAFKESGWGDRLGLMKAATGKLLPEVKVSDPSRLRQGMLS
ncbi:MAG: hypothetical protein GY824_04545, partial [Delftia sp.]|nr:hypothetical protein [Delftia sp.]